MDPFAPENPQDVEELQHVLDQLHDNFKGVVKEARGHKLDLDAPDLFEGKYWYAHVAGCVMTTATASFVANTPVAPQGCG